MIFKQNKKTILTPLKKNANASGVRIPDFYYVVPSGIEPEYQVPETCVLSIVLRDQSFKSSFYA